MHLTLRHRPRLDVSALWTEARLVHIARKTPLRGYRQAAFYRVPLSHCDRGWGRVVRNMAGCLSRFARPPARYPVRSGLVAWDGTYPRSVAGGSLIIVLGRGTYCIAPIAGIGGLRVLRPPAPLRHRPPSARGGVALCQEDCRPIWAKAGWTLEGAGKAVQIDIQYRGRTAIAALQGEFDLACANEVRRQLDEVIDAGVSRLVVDLQGVRFIDSSGLGVLLGRYRRLSEAGGELLLLGPRPSVRTVLDLSGVPQVVRVLESQSEVQG